MATVIELNHSRRRRFGLKMSNFLVKKLLLYILPIMYSKKSGEIVYVLVQSV